MSTDPSRRSQLPGASTRVHGDLFADDEAIGNELADSLTGVGVGYLADLIGIKPDLALTATDNGGGQTLLGTKIDPDGDDRSAGALQTKA